MRLLRDVANITMDLNGLENANINTLGSADVTTVNDLSGTDLKHVNVNLAAAGGGGDGAADIVIANGTNGPDKVHVGTLDGNVLVSGLSAALQIAGSEGASDGLQINTLGGKDSVAIASGVAQLINPTVDLGAPPEPLFCDIALAQRIERVEADLIAASSRAASRRRGEAAGGFTIPIAGGVASPSPSPLRRSTRSAGLGFAGEPDAAALDEIERAFAAHGAPVSVELSNLATPRSPTY